MRAAIGPGWSWFGRTRYCKEMEGMWTSERSRRLFQAEAAAELGAVTLGGGPAGVSLGGERRWLPLCCPGGVYMAARRRGSGGGA